jgi:hypothetical protein
VKFILFVEGKTEKQSLADFVARSINPRLPSPVGFSVIKFEGVGDYIANIKRRVELYFSQRQQEPIVAAIGLIDLYGSSLSSPQLSAAENVARGRTEIERQVGHSRFKQHFAVHEVEAWLLGHAEILPRAVRDALSQKCSRPETVNMHEPPSKLLRRLYQQHLNRPYHKVLDGRRLFLDCDPNIVAAKCPHFSQMLTEMEQLAKTAL